MSSHSCSSLVGNTVRIDIAEPWDFSSTLGENVLEGTVLAGSGVDHGPEWLHCKVSEFLHEGQRISEVVLVSRHRVEEPLHQLLNGHRVGVNVVYQPGHPPHADAIGRLLGSGAPFLAGSARVKVA